MPKPRLKLDPERADGVARLHDLGDGRYRVEGPLDYFTTATILEESEEKFHPR